MALSKKEKLSREKQRMYAWVAYMVSHESTEMKHFLKYGTPSDRLIEVSNKRIEFVSQGIKKFRMCPLSLSSSKGQKMAFNALKRISTFITEIPEYAYSHFKAIEANFSHRRSDTKTNALMVAEALCHRAATEFKYEILFAFDSINTWLKSVYGKELGYLTLRRALEMLEEQGFIQVTEWGVKNVRTKATKIKLMLKQKIDCGFLADDWVLMASHAMNKVYSRESTTRQNVLEHHIHSYAEELSTATQVSTDITGRRRVGSFPRGLVPITGKYKSAKVFVTHGTMVAVEEKPLTLEEMIAILLE